MSEISNADNVVPDEEPDEEASPECVNCGFTLDLERDGYTTIIPNGWHGRRLDPDAENYFCDECYCICEDCGESHMSDGCDSWTVDGDYRVLCHYCQNDYTSCSECDNYVHYDNAICDEYDDSCRCRSCYEDSGGSMRGIVHYYSWQPDERLFWYIPREGDHPYGESWKFDGIRALPEVTRWLGRHRMPEDVSDHMNDLFMGFELETNRGSCRNVREAAEYLLNNVSMPDGKNEHIFGGSYYRFRPENYLYLKEDGSIDGFEIVSHPATLEAHKLLFPGQAVRDLGRKHGMQGWRGAGAGLHVHVSKAAFGHSHMHKFQLFHYRNAEFLKRFAGRDSGRWASFDQTADCYGRPMKLSSLAKGDYDRGALQRYHALNFMPPYTVELRYFRSSLLPETVLSVLEMVHAMWQFTRDHTSTDYRNDGFGWSNFRAWLARQDRYEFLPDTLDKRGV